MVLREFVVVSKAIGAFTHEACGHPRKKIGALGLKTGEGLFFKECARQNQALDEWAVIHGSPSIFF
jgi:hypothetical protein